ncbi:MAG: hypothetical protein ACOVRN_16860 [Flavobacterium sp.]
MASIADLFNPSFFLFLGIMVLVVAVLVIYFESKIRDQNHKINSMMSLVSTLAEEVGGVREHMIGGMLATHSPATLVQEKSAPLGVSRYVPPERLIEVSDDDEESESEKDASESESECDTDIDSDEEDDEEDEEEDEEKDEEDTNDIKVIKLIVSEEDEVSHEDIVPFEFDPVQDLAEFEADTGLEDNIPEITEEYVHDVLNLSYEENNVISINESVHMAEEDILPSESELKSISVHVEDGGMDYKKVQLPKLRSIVVEKGLASSADAGKMKKHELLKVLGVE